MALSYFEWNGKKSSDMGLYIESRPSIPKPQRQVEVISVPGRSGALRIDKGGYNNITVSYQCWFRGGPATAAAISDWLYASGNYGELRDSYNPGGFRVAAFDGPMDIENIMNRYGRCTLSFDCKPQFWTDAGQDLIAVTGETRVFGTELFNPYNTYAQPWIRLIPYDDFADGFTASITISGPSSEDTSAFTILDAQNGIDLDSETQNASWDGVNCNTYVGYVVSFPRLRPGLNAITVAGYQVPQVKEVDIIPRWWHL